MRTVFLVTIFTLCFSTLFAQECEYQKGFPVIIETKNCTSDGTKFCRAKVLCGGLESDLICPAASPFTCPTANECKKESSGLRREGKISDDLLHSEGERVAKKVENKKVPLQKIDLGDGISLSAEQMADVDGAWLQGNCADQALEKVKGLLFDFAINQMKMSEN